MDNEEIARLWREAAEERHHKYQTEQDEAAQNYTPKFLTNLAREFKIERPHIAAMHNVLRFAAWLYRDLQHEHENSPRPQKLRKELSQFYSVMTDACSTLDRLSEPAVDILWHPQRTLYDRVVFSDESVSEFGHTIIRNYSAPDAWETRFLNEYNIVEAIHILRKLAERATKSIRPAKSGPPSGEPLRMWVVNVEKFWVRTLSRKFTYDALRGEGITEAAKFCAAAIKPLDPNVSQAALNTAMRKAIRMHPKIRP